MANRREFQNVQYGFIFSPGKAKKIGLRISLVYFATVKMLYFSIRKHTYFIAIK